MLLSIEAGARENTRNAYPDTAIPADMSQQDNVTGKVTDENGDPLVGVMVYIEGTTTGTMTETDGTYTLKPKSSAESFTVIFSYLGMTTQKVTASPGQVVNIKMQNDNELAAAVINGGYGVIQSKEDLTGSAFQVNNDIIEKFCRRGKHFKRTDESQHKSQRRRFIECIKRASLDCRWN